MNQNANYQRSVGISGKYVNDFSEITANDVPMDIPSSVFIKADGSEIQIRSWNGQGLIDTKTYKPILEENIANGTNTLAMPKESEFEHFNAILDDIKSSVDDVLTSMEKVLKMNKPTTRAKKESDAE